MGPGFPDSLLQAVQEYVGACTLGTGCSLVAVLRWLSKFCLFVFFVQVVTCDLKFVNLGDELGNQRGLANWVRKGWHDERLLRRGGGERGRSFREIV
jgi:hypothetical protein